MAFVAYQGLFSSKQHSQNYTYYRNLVDMRCYTVYYVMLFAINMWLGGIEMYGKYNHFTLFKKLYTLPTCLTMFLLCIMPAAIH